MEGLGTDVPPGSWKLDPARSELGFSVRHLMVATIRGRFTALEGGLDAKENPQIRFTSRHVEGAPGLSWRDALETAGAIVSDRVRIALEVVAVSPHDV